jgi:integrase
VTYDAELKGFGVRVSASGRKSWVIEYRPGAGGRGVAKRRFTIGPATILTPEQARTAARDLLASVRMGSDPAATRAKARQTPTLAEITERYLREEVDPKRKAGTAALYRHYLTQLVAPELGAIRITDLTRADIARLHRALGNTRPVTANRVVATLSGVFTFAARDSIVPAGFNPTRHIDKFREEARERFLSDEELDRLGSAIREAETVGIPWDPDPANPKAKHAPKVGKRRTIVSPFATAAMRLLLFTGARLREILHLRWDEVDLERGLLFLPDSKTGRKTIVLSAPALAVLANLPRAGEYVIAGGSASKPRSDLKKPWALVSGRAGLAGVRLHDLRHSFASVGAGGGLGLPIIGKLLGHSQASTTQRYAHLDADPLRRASNSIAGAIAAAMGEKAPGANPEWRK